MWEKSATFCRLLEPELGGTLHQGAMTSGGVQLADSDKQMLPAGRPLSDSGSTCRQMANSDKQTGGGGSRYRLADSDKKISMYV